MRVIDFDRLKAVAYAEKWALKRNPKYYDFSLLGGDCTNFISQCILAGNSTMNYMPITGWYYINTENRSASWTDVDYLYKFLTTNKGIGPFGELIDKTKAELGDIVQLGNSQTDFYHSLLITKIYDGKFYVTAHSNDALNRELDTYYYSNIRFIKIKGTRL